MPTIYIDMDGVIADFERAAEEIIQVPAGELHKDSQNYWPREQWEQLLAYPRLYRTLHKMPEADRMIELARLFRDQLGWRLRVLTAIPRKNDFPYVFQDKVEWMQEHYPDIPVFFGPYSEDKHRHCEPGDILVDDRTSNCQEWQQAQGTAILVTNNYGQALAELTQVFDQRVTEAIANQRFITNFIV